MVRWLAMTLALLLGVPSWAGIDIAPGGDDPFPTAGNKVLVVDFQTSLGDPAGADVGALFARSLLAQLSVGLPGGLGVVRLVVPPGEPVTYTQVDAWAEQYQADIVLWGEVYPSGDRTFVVTRLSLQGIRDDGTLDVGISRGEAGRAVARLLSRSLAFAPIPLASADLVGLGQSGDEARTIYAEPDRHAEVLGRIREGQVFSLGEVPGAPAGWRRVYLQSGPAGWVRAGAPRGSPLREVPALQVAEALFLLRARRPVDGVLSPLLDQPDAMPGPTAAAVHLIAGISALRQADSAAGVHAARALFDRAAALHPPSRDAPNYRFVAEVALDQHGEALDLAAAERRVVEAITAGGSLDSVKNLGLLYALPEAVDALANGDQDRLTEARARQQALLARLGAQGGPPADEDLPADLGPSRAEERLPEVRFIVRAPATEWAEVRVRCGDHEGLAPGVVTLRDVPAGRCVVAYRALDSLLPPRGGSFATTAVQVERAGQVHCQVQHGKLRCTPP
jgi:hypothetical protein